MIHNIEKMTINGKLNDNMSDCDKCCRKKIRQERRIGSENTEQVVMAKLNQGVMGALTRKAILSRGWKEGVG